MNAMLDECNVRYTTVQGISNLVLFLAQCKANQPSLEVTFDVMRTFFLSYPAYSFCSTGNPPKPFVQDNIHQATPRRALGDVRNLQTQRVIGPQKTILQSDKKGSTHGVQQNRTSLTTPGKFSSFLKPSGTSKKSNKKAIKILEDDVIENEAVKNVDGSARQKGNIGPDLFQKEAAFPFIEKGSCQ